LLIGFAKDTTHARKKESYAPKKERIENGLKGLRGVVKKDDEEPMSEEERMRCAKRLKMLGLKIKISLRKAKLANQTLKNENRVLGARIEYAEDILSGKKRAKPLPVDDNFPHRRPAW